MVQQLQPLGGEPGHGRRVAGGQRGERADAGIGQPPAVRARGARDEAEVVVGAPPVGALPREAADVAVLGGLGVGRDRAGAEGGLQSPGEAAVQGGDAVERDALAGAVTEDHQRVVGHGALHGADQPGVDR